MYKEVSMQQVIQTLGEYIKEQYNAELDKQENIFNSGIIDSLGFVNLIGFISEAFEIEFEPEDLIEDNFYSLERMAQVILQKKE
jgi:acyl carrier protein